MEIHPNCADDEMCVDIVITIARRKCSDKRWRAVDVGHIHLAAIMYNFRMRVDQLPCDFGEYEARVAPVAKQKILFKFIPFIRNALMMQTIDSS